MQAYQVTLDTEGRVVWPFPSINGHQTPQSLVLQSNKALHKPTPKDLTDIGEALL